MVVDKARGEADFQMLFFNSDGSVGEMCGNGARCICRYGYEIGLAGEHQVVETTAGIVTGDRISRCQYRVRLNDPPPPSASRRFLTVGDKAYPCSYVELGEPRPAPRWSPAPAWPRPIPRLSFSWAGPCGITPASPRGPT